MKILTKGDKIIAVFLALLALGTYLTFAFCVSAVSPDSVEIFVDGEKYASYTLSGLDEEKTVKISSAYGENLLRLFPDGVQMIDATCPDKRDVRMGKITKPGQTIICIPNRVLVKLRGDADDTVDKVTY